MCEIGAFEAAATDFRRQRTDIRLERWDGTAGEWKSKALPTFVKYCAKGGAGHCERARAGHYAVGASVRGSALCSRRQTHVTHAAHSCLLLLAWPRAVMTSFHDASALCVF
jgi:hypothetical protein